MGYQFQNESKTKSKFNSSQVLHCISIGFTYSYSFKLLLRPKRVKSVILLHFYYELNVFGCVACIRVSLSVRSYKK